MGKISDDDIQHLIDVGQKGEPGFITNTLLELQTLRKAITLVGELTYEPSFEDIEKLTAIYEEWEQL